MSTVVAPHISTRVGVHVIDALQLDFIQIIPSMPTMISLMLGLGLTPHEGAKSKSQRARMLLTH